MKCTKLPLGMAKFTLFLFLVNVVPVFIFLDCPDTRMSGFKAGSAGLTCVQYGMAGRDGEELASGRLEQRTGDIVREARGARGESG